MKKMLVWLMVIVMTAAMLGCALADGAMYEKDIQFSGHTFGETFTTARQSVKVESIDFDTGRFARYSRMIADPAGSNVVWLSGESEVPYLFSTRCQWQTVAGHEAQPVLYFMFPSNEAAQSFDLGSATLYGATYNFYDGDAKNNYEDLKNKLASVYGEPFAEDADANEIWGPLLMNRTDINQEDIDRNYQEGIDRNSPISSVAWKSSTNNGLIYLVSYNENGSWEMTSLHYFDLSADEAIVAMYASDSGAVVSDSVDGL